MNKEFDIVARDKLIFGKYRESKYKFGNIAAFKDMKLKTLCQLIENGFLDLDDNYKNRLSVRDVYEFMQWNKEYTCHGYCTFDKVLIEGVCKGSPVSSAEEFNDYMEIFSDMTRFDPNTMYCLFE